VGRRSAGGVLAFRGRAAGGQGRAMSGRPAKVAPDPTLFGPHPGCLEIDGLGGVRHPPGTRTSPVAAPAAPGAGLHSPTGTGTGTATSFRLYLLWVGGVGGGGGGGWGGGLGGGGGGANIFVCVWFFRFRHRGGLLPKRPALDHPDRLSRQAQSLMSRLGSPSPETFALEHLQRPPRSSRGRVQVSPLPTLIRW